ncbi:hypothetical protein HPP92_004386 [Vanilla planifolia]|uniref:Uncharacterized protein n=1 Tax=Vanilla planifolia TaxID=51239 RepID=A0A835S3J5_VANPL|nr:hypothetical protein HPP92_004386 [Vanilla planifolia]
MDHSDSDSHSPILVTLLQHKTIESVLARGEKLDSLVEKSSDLSAASQVLICDVGFDSIGPES